MNQIEQSEEVDTIIEIEKKLPCELENPEFNHKTQVKKNEASREFESIFKHRRQLEKIDIIPKLEKKLPQKSNSPIINNNKTTKVIQVSTESKLELPQKSNNHELNLNNQLKKTDVFLEFEKNLPNELEYKYNQNNCSVCFKVFSDSVKFAEHEKTHYEFILIQSTELPIVSLSPATYTVTSNSSSFQTTQCHVKFTSNLESDTIPIVPRSSATCTVISNSSRFQSNLESNEHLKTNNNQKSSTQRILNENSMAKSNNNSNGNMITNVEKKQFKKKRMECSTCNGLFNSKSKYFEHFNDNMCKKSSFRKRPNNNNGCEKTMAPKREINKSENNNILFTSSGEEPDEILVISSGEESDEILVISSDEESDTVEKCITCELCHNRFDSRLEYNKHIKTHRCKIPISSLILSNNKTVNTSKTSQNHSHALEALPRNQKQFFCKFCNKICNKLDHLEIHLWEQGGSL